MNQLISTVSGNLNQNSFFQDFKPWTDLVSSIGIVAAAIIAGLGIHQSNKQLKIEQTPHVVLDHIRKIDIGRFGFAIKNVGKGPAFHITFNTSGTIKNRNEAFFSNDQPHSANLRSSEESHYWKVDNNVLDNLLFKDNFAKIYGFFEDQDGSLFRTVVKIKKIIKDDGTVRYIVMENNVRKLKGEVGE